MVSSVSNSPPPDEYLSSDEVMQLRTQLVRQAESILSNNRSAMAHLTEARAADADSLDLAVSESNRDFNLRIADRERRKLAKVRNALHRIHEGEYGVCERCGEAITFGRLTARPVATQCIDCKTQNEQLRS